MAGTALRAVVGLGNPGAEYARTRHNAGFWFADLLAVDAGDTFRAEARFQGDFAKIRFAGTELLLLKPMTFMNRSGQAVQALASYFKIEPEAILVAHDELDLPAGSVRLKRGGGHGGHNGLRDLHAHLGEAYARLRIGIGHPGHKSQVLGHVLGRPTAEEEAAIRKVLVEAVDALRVALTESWDKATQRLHTTAPPPAAKPATPD